MAGRFAVLPQQPPRGVQLHLLHGTADTVMRCALSVAAAERVESVGGQPSIDLIDGAGHEIDAAVAARLLERLSGAQTAARVTRPATGC